MIQRTFSARNFSETENSLRKIKRLIPSGCEKNALLQIYDTDNSEEHLYALLELSKKILPSVATVGCTLHLRAGTLVLPFDGTLLSLIIFEKSSFKIAVYDWSEGGEIRSGNLLRAEIEKTPSAKGVLILSSGKESDVPGFLKSAYSPGAKIPLFGLQAGVRDWSARSDPLMMSVFSDSLLHHKGAVSVIFFGEELHVRTGYNFGWHPIGKKMTVTKTDGMIVRTIDDEPAANIYRKYLGVTSSNSEITSSVMEFPIVVRQGNRTLARIAENGFSDGSILFFADMEEGEQIQMSYGNINDILSETRADSNGVKDFGAQAVIVVACPNRNEFMGKGAEEELAFYSDALPDAASVHGFSELLYDETGGGILNSALVSVAFREGEKKSGLLRKVCYSNTRHSERSEESMSLRNIDVSPGQRPLAQHDSRHTLCNIIEKPDESATQPLHIRLENFLAATTAELEETARQANSAKEFIRETLGKVVTDEVRDYLLEGNVSLGGQTLDVTVMFCDIRSFTTLSEKMEPKNIVALLNEYFTEMEKCIAGHGGIINKYIGDAVMAVFGAPVASTTHARDAYLASVAMRDALVRLNGRFAQKGFPELRFGIALHSGTVLAGNIGAPSRMEYTVIGDTVNTASRIEGLCKVYKKDLLISESTASRMGNEAELSFVDEAEIRGRKGKVKLFTA